MAELELLLPVNYDFSDGVRWTLRAARGAAQSLRHDYVGTEHLLAGLVEAKEAEPLLTRLGVSRAEVERKLADAVRPGQAAVSERGELPYTRRAKKTLELAMEAARELHRSRVSTDELLLGLLREEKSIAAAILEQLGVTVDAVHRALGGAASEPRFFVRIDDTSELSIYEQIVAQVQEAVATGVLLAGDRLPAVRQLADELDVAPGTVARAYGELERLGVVVTEGARGTRIAARGRPAEPELPETLAGLLRPVAVAAFHMGASAPELRTALERAMRGIFAETE